MSLDASQVRVGVTGHIYKAPEGTAAPADVGALPADWIELGYTETGPSQAVDTSKEQFTPWQSLLPVRETVTGQMITATFNLWQRNAETLKLAFNGGAITAGTGDVRIYTPPPAAAIAVASFIIEVIDGLIIDRYYIERASATLDGEVAFAKDAVTGFPISLTYLQPAGGGSPWKLITNDTAVEVDA